MEMNADSKRKPRQSDRILAERARRHQEEALDDALKKHLSGIRPSFHRTARSTCCGSRLNA
jgi:hypothetical protein